MHQWQTNQLWWRSTTMDTETKTATTTKISKEMMSTQTTTTISWTTSTMQVISTMATLMALTTTKTSNTAAMTTQEAQQIYPQEKCESKRRECRWQRQYRHQYRFDIQWRKDWNRHNTNEDNDAKFDYGTLLITTATRMRRGHDTNNIRKTFQEESNKKKRGLLLGCAIGDLLCDKLKRRWTSRTHWIRCRLPE